MSVRKLAALVAAVCAMLLVVPMTAGAQTIPSPTPSTGTAVTSLQKIPVSGKARNGKKFTGQFSVDRFVKRNGQAYALGTLKGNIGHRTVTRKGVAIPVKVGQNGNVTSAQAACPILHLTLGPLDLNLLGLKVHLDRVVLDITAQPGPGNLLGNLLCQVAGLLNGGGLSLSQLTGVLNLLNQLLSNLSVLTL